MNNSPHRFLAQSHKGLPWRWPTSSAHKATASWTGTRRASAFSNSKLSAPFRTAARPRWAAILTPVSDAVIRPSPITPAVTATAPSARRKAREQWLNARERELLATSYFHVVFTVPHELNVLALENPRVFYDLLFRASAQPYWKWRPIPNISARRSASSVSCIRGGRTCCRTLTHNACHYHVVDSQGTVRVDFPYIPLPERACPFGGAFR